MNSSNIISAFLFLVSAYSYGNDKFNTALGQCILKVPQDLYPKIVTQSEYKTQHEALKRLHEQKGCSFSKNIDIYDNLQEFISKIQNNDQERERMLILKAGYFDQVKTGITRRRDIREHLQQYITHHAINLQQKFCLLKCITGSTFEYTTRSGESTFPKNIEYLYGRGKELGEGMCYDFARIALDVAEFIGIKEPIIKYVISDFLGHAYNQITLNGDNYYIDPIDSECIFIKDK